MWLVFLKMKQLLIQIFVQISRIEDVIPKLSQIKSYNLQNLYIFMEHPKIPEMPPLFHFRAIYEDRINFSEPMSRTRWSKKSL